MGERNYALRLRETDGVGVVTVFAKMVVSSAVVTIPSSGTVPNRVFGLELMAEAAAMGEWSGSR